MAGIRLPPEDSDVSQAARQVAAVDLISDDDRSIAADSWSIKSDYGSTLDDEQRQADAAEALSSAAYRAASDYSSDKEEPDAEAVSSMLGFQSYWDAAYADELTNFREHGHTGEVWFGPDVMENMATWSKNICLEISQRNLPNHVDSTNCLPAGQPEKDLSGWSILDVGTGNGLLLQELSKLGFSDLTGTDYSEAAVDLARSLAQRDGFPNIKFLVDDILETKLDRQFQLVTDKGTLDAIGLHPDGPIKRIMYWDTLSGLVASGGLVVITSCNSTKDELIQEVEAFNQRRNGGSREPDSNQDVVGRDAIFEYVDHIRTYPTFMFGGSVGSRVATVAILRNSDKEEPDAEAVSSMLGFQSYWDAAYADELTNFREHGHTGEVWFGPDVMENMATWTKNICLEISQRNLPNHVDSTNCLPSGQPEKDLSGWSILDVGTGNGLLLQELSKLGFSDLTGTDYSEAAVDLARSLAQRDGFPNIKFLVDDILETKLDRQFQLVTDKGTLDAIGLHPDGPIKRIMYWDSLSGLVASGGLVVITSCNSTKDELIQEVEAFNQRRNGGSREPDSNQDVVGRDAIFEYVDHIRTYPTFMFGGSVGSRVATVAILRK